MHRWISSATGGLVTNSIVVVENIILKLGKSSDVTTASVEGTNEVIIAVAASALTNIVVFLPVTQMQSIIGNFVKPFGVTMVVVTAASLFISFTLVPILTDKYLTKDTEIKNPLLKWFSKSWNWCYSKFDNICQKSCGIGVVGGLLLSAILTVYLIPALYYRFTKE